MVIDFDDIDDWEPFLSEKLKSLVPTAIMEKIVAAAPDEVHDACKLLIDATCHTAIIAEIIGWVSSATVAGYHGTRLTEVEVDSVRAEGLLPMRAGHRRARVERALSCHECWPRVAARLDEKLRAFGPAEKAGRREGQVHLTLSRSGLLYGFNKYLTHGAEIDRHIAFSLLGLEGEALLANDGEARLVKVAIPGDKALAAANPFWSVEECLATDRVPNLISELLGSWSYRLAHPTFQCRSLQLDCGMIFHSTIPSAWITEIETL